MLVSRWPTSPPVHGLGHGHGEPAVEQEPAHHDFKGVLVLAPAVRPEGLAHLSLHGGQRRLRRAAGGRARAELHPHVAVHRDAGDGDRALDAEPAAEALLRVRGREAGGVQRAEHGALAPAEPLARERAQMRLHEGGEHRGAGGQHRHRGAPGLEHPRGLPRRGPEQGALRQERQAIEPPRHRLPAPGEVLLHRGEELVVQHQPRPAEARERAPDHLAARAARLGEHHHQRGRLDRAAQGFLHRGLVLVHDLARGHRHALGQERARHHHPRRVVGRGQLRGAHRQDPGAAHGRLTRGRRRGRARPARAPARRRPR